MHLNGDFTSSGLPMGFVRLCTAINSFLCPCGAAPEIYAQCFLDFGTFCTVYSIIPSLLSEVEAFFTVYDFHDMANVDLTLRFTTTYCFRRF